MQDNLPCMTQVLHTSKPFWVRLWSKVFEAQTRIKILGSVMVEGFRGTNTSKDFGFGDSRRFPRQTRVKILGPVMVEGFRGTNTSKHFGFGNGRKFPSQTRVNIWGPMMVEGFRGKHE